jgi:hypothetical protein
MRSGYRTTLELLEGNHRWEASLAEKFETLAEEQSEPALNKILSDIALRCRKNNDKIGQLLHNLSSEAYEVTLKCPICGWGIPYGSHPALGAELKCELCAIWFRLEEREGDYYLQKLGRKDRH